MHKTFSILFLILFLFTGCASQTVGEDASYIRVSRGEYGASLLRWLGLAAEGDYCMLSSSENEYEWTLEDLEFFKEQCPNNPEVGQLIQLLEVQ